MVYPLTASAAPVARRTPVRDTGRVLDGDGDPVAVVCRLELLDRPVPHLQEGGQSEAKMKEPGPFSGTTPTGIRIRWTRLFSRTVIEVWTTPIESITVPTRGTATIDDPFSTVVSTIVQHRVDPVAVLDSEKAAGFESMTNAFDAVARQITEYSQTACTNREAAGGRA